MTELELRNIAEVFSKISGEVILKRRQTLFLSLYNLDDRHKSFLINTISLSLALKTHLDVSPRVTINNAYKPFSESIGKVLYYAFAEDFVGTRRELKKLPNYLQGICSFILGNKLILQLTHEFLFNMINQIQPYSKLVTEFITLPSEEPVENLEKLVSFSRNLDLKFPFKVLRRSKAHRTKGKLYYLTKSGEGVKTNISLKNVKDYLSTQCNLTEYGVIISLVYNKRKSRVRHIQIVALLDNPIELKKLYTGKTKSMVPTLDSFWNYFSKPQKNLEVTVKQPVMVTSVVNMTTNPHLLDNGNIIIHDKGIALLDNKPKATRGRVIDWLLDDSYEPLGYKVKVDDKVIDVVCKITNEDLEDGIENTYLNLRQTMFLGEVIRTEYFGILSSKYGECALCGKVDRLISKYLCYTCHTTLYKVLASSTLSVIFLKEDKPPHTQGVKFNMDKYECEFVDDGMRFRKNLDLVKGKQQRLIYNWWDKEDWKWESYKNASIQS